MLTQVERRNRELWEGHSRVLADATHVLGGLGLGLLLHPTKRGATRPVGWALVLLSTAVHIYADMVKPNGGRRAGVVDRLRGMR